MLIPYQKFDRLVVADESRGRQSAVHEEYAETFNAWLKDFPVGKRNVADKRQFPFSAKDF